MDCIDSSVHGISQKEHWNELPFPPPGDLPDPGIEPTTPASASGFFTTEPPGKPNYILYKNKQPYHHSPTF